MRILAFILSFYFAALSVIPCADGQQQATPKVDTQEVVNEHDHNHSEHEDDCTTLCICACCGTTITLSTTTELSYVKTIIATDNSFPYHFNYSFTFCEGKWHPPALI